MLKTRCDDQQPNRSGDPTMFAKTKIALAAAIVLGTAVAAFAATKPQAAQITAAVYTKIPGYNGAGAVVAIPDPDHSSQSQLSGDENPLRH